MDTNIPEKQQQEDKVLVLFQLITLIGSWGMLSWSALTER